MYNLDAMMAGMAGLFQLKVLLFLIGGFVVGYIVGAIPGFNDANVMAILLPFTLGLEPTTAIVAMAAIYAAAQAAGSIPAILINIPGTPGTAATTLEGYPLAKAGRAAYALGISFTASTVGALVGAAFTLAFAPVLGTFALSFGPAEMFLVVLLGLTVVSTLSINNVERGLLSAAFGILISLVGADEMAAFPRGTFGIAELYDGIALIPVLLGLFGFSELILLLSQSGDAVATSAPRDEKLKSEIFAGIRETLRQRINLLRSTVVGFIVGVIPGAGATIGSFLAYGQAQQWSREPDKFGTGCPEGLVATDSANNATAAGAMVPLLTLGIPGSASTLVMLAALVMMGVRPGPEFFVNFQADAYTIIFSLFLGGLLIGVLGLALAVYAQKIAYVPKAILIPVVSLLVFIGAYAWHFLAFDILVMIVFGVLGAVMRALRYPVAPLLLAVILGPILESDFIRAVNIGGYESFLAKPIDQILAALVVLSVFGPMAIGYLRQYRARHSGRLADQEGTESL